MESVNKAPQLLLVYQNSAETLPPSWKPLVCILIQRHLPPHFLQHPLKQWAHDIVSLKDPVSLKSGNAPHTVFS